ncbi:MAG: transcription antitermination factor NusB [Peptococcaceae bacterium]|jgi:N utilization substance protein B|nr:transcription antitermination factor NusB [Peptococcaceae bacterium]
MRRRDIRELVIKALFAYEIEKGDPWRQLAYIAEDGEMGGFAEGQEGVFLAGGESDYARRLMGGILEQREALDQVIAEYAVDWEIQRLGGIERNILRLGLYEMLYGEKLPPAIAINEALDLVKKYGGQEAARFVNGILGKRAKARAEERAPAAADGARAEEIAPAAAEEAPAEGDPATTPVTARDAEGSR